MRGTASIALAATLAAALPGCFPDDPKARHIAYAAEVGAMAAGILTLAFVHPAGDCDVHDQSCINKGNAGEAIGLTLLFGGLAAAVVTLVSSEDTQRKTIVTPASGSAAPAK